jgi:hypothetical protein
MGRPVDSIIWGPSKKVTSLSRARINYPLPPTPRWHWQWVGERRKIHPYLVLDEIRAYSSSGWTPAQAEAAFMGEWRPTSPSPR